MNLGLGLVSSILKPKLSKILFIPDTHVPFHDKRAFNLVLKAGTKFKPDIVVVGGDFGDFYSVSFHEKDPNKASSLKQEVSKVRRELKRIEDLGAKKNIFVEGNHEARLGRYINEKAPALFGLVSVRDLLGLEKWEFVPYKEATRVGKLLVTHDLGQSGKEAIRGAHDQTHSNVVIFHIHRLGVYYCGNMGGDTHVAASFGWLGDRRNSVFKYAPAPTVIKDWQLGFGIGHMEQNGTVHLQGVPIVNYKAVVGGEVICG